MARKKGRRTRSPRGAGALSSVPLETLQAELQRRRRAAMPLVKRRARVAAKLAEIDARLSQLGLDAGDSAARTASAAGRPRPGRRGAAGGRQGRRTRGAKGLVDVLHTVLTGKIMRVTEATEAVLQAGYKTASKNFRTVINQTLLVNKDRFRKVSRGKYTAK